MPMNDDILRLQSLAVTKVLDVLPDPAWLSDARGQTFITNLAYQRRFQTTEVTLEGLQWVIAGHAREQVVEKFLSGIAGGEPFQLTFPFEQQDGLVWHEVTVSPMREGGTLQAWFGCLKTLSETEGFLEALLENAPVGLGLLDQDYRVRLLNPKVMEGNQYSREELQKRTLGDLYPEVFPQLKPHIDHVLQTGEAALPLEVESPARPDGTPAAHWRVHYFPVRSKSGDLLGVGYASDNIQALKASELSLKQQRAFLERLTDGVPATIQLRNLQTGELEFSNPYAFSVIGFTRDEVLNMPQEEVLRLFPEEDLPRILEVTEKIKRLQDGETLEDEYRVQHKDGTWRWFFVRSSVFERAADGSALKSLSVGVDITERKHAELLLKESESRLQTLMEGHTRFVSDASHEIKTPLAGIQGNLEVLLRYPDIPESEKKEIVEDCHREAVRLGRLVSDLLSMARTGQGLLMLETEMRFDHLVLDTVRDFESIKGDHELNIGEVHACTVEGDPDRLKQLLVILTGNALKYTPDGGRVTLNLCCHSNQIELRVKDTGIGIRPEDLDRVFERYYRADHSALGRDPGGTGLGLPIARWIVEQHGGRIQLHSEPGKGTEVVVHLPGCLHP